MPRHNKARRETNGKCNDPRRYFGSNIDAAKQVGHLFMEQKVDGKIFDKDVENSVRTAAGKIPECLRRYPAGKRPVAKVYDTYYDMSG